MPWRLVGKDNDKKKIKTYEQNAIWSLYGLAFTVN